MKDILYFITLIQIMYQEMRNNYHSKFSNSEIKSNLLEFEISDIIFHSYVML